MLAGRVIVSLRISVLLRSLTSNSSEPYCSPKGWARKGETVFLKTPGKKSNYILVTEVEELILRVT